MKSISHTLDHHNKNSDVPKGITRLNRGSMTPAKINLFLMGALAIFLAFFGSVAQFSNPLISGVTSSAAALTVITAAAVGIERVLEAFWTYM